MYTIKIRSNFNCSIFTVSLLWIIQNILNHSNRPNTTVKDWWVRIVDLTKVSSCRYSDASDTGRET